MREDCTCTLAKTKFIVLDLFRGDVILLCQRVDLSTVSFMYAPMSGYVRDIERPRHVPPPPLSSIFAESNFDLPAEVPPTPPPFRPPHSKTTRFDNGQVHGSLWDV